MFRKDSILQVIWKLCPCLHSAADLLIYLHACGIHHGSRVERLWYHGWAHRNQDLHERVLWWNSMVSHNLNEKWPLFHNCHAEIYKILEWKIFFSKMIKNWIYTEHKVYLKMCLCLGVNCLFAKLEHEYWYYPFHYFVSNLCGVMSLIV